MYLIFIFLYKEVHLTDVLLAITEVCGEKAIILDGVASETQLASSIPIFSDFSSSIHGAKRYCKVIITQSSRENVAQEIYEALKEGGIDFIKDNIGSIIEVSAKIIGYSC